MVVAVVRGTAPTERVINDAKLTVPGFDRIAIISDKKRWNEQRQKRYAKKEVWTKRGGAALTRNSKGSFLVVLLVYFGVIRISLHPGALR